MRDRELFEREIETLSGNEPEASQEVPGICKEQVGANAASGANFYVDLKVDAAKFPDVIKHITVFRQVGIYAPPVVKDAEFFDLVFFFHGHVTECGLSEKTFNTHGIQCLWNQQPFVPLRRELLNSGKPAVLVMPKFDAWVGKKKGAAGYLHLDKEETFAALQHAVLMELIAQKAVDARADSARTFIAAIGAGGEPMQKVLSTSSPPRECIGFETLSFGWEAWRAWSQCSEHILMHYRTKGWNEKYLADHFKYGINKNVMPEKTRCELFEKNWPAAFARFHISAFEKMQPWTKMPKRELEYEVPRDTSVGAATAAGAVGGAAGAAAPFVLHTFQPQRTPARLVYTPRTKKAYDRYHREHPAAAPADHPVFVQVQQAPDIFMRTILRDARERARRARDTGAAAILDPDTWFTQFTRIKFLGRAFNAGQYVHVEFAKKLREVEDALVASIGGTARSVGDTLLNNRNETHAASRSTSGTSGYSYHMFGLAIDVNYLGDPMIGDGAVETLRRAVRQASQLLRGTVLGYTRGRGPAHYDAVAQLDQLLEQYFALLDDAAALRNAVAAATLAPWRGKSEAAARRLIQQDLNDLSDKVSRGGSQRATFKARALLDFDRRLVVAMTSAGLDWGAWYGDMMHFDMRTHGVGRYIDAAIGVHKDKATRQMNRFLADRDFGYHAFVD